MRTSDREGKIVLPNTFTYVMVLHKAQTLYKLKVFITSLWKIPPYFL